MNVAKGKLHLESSMDLFPSFSREKRRSSCVSHNDPVFSHCGGRLQGKYQY